jgi:hypothetical protein
MKIKLIKKVSLITRDNRINTEFYKEITLTEDQIRAARDLGFDVGLIDGETVVENTINFSHGDIELEVSSYNSIEKFYDLNEEEQTIMKNFTWVTNCSYCINLIDFEILDIIPFTEEKFIGRFKKTDWKGRITNRERLSKTYNEYREQMEKNRKEYFDPQHKEKALNDFKEKIKELNEKGWSEL